MRRQLGWKSVGHAGTLDPSASGVLIVLCGDATVRADEFMDLAKEYVARVRFGISTTTDDFEGDVLESRTVDEWSLTNIQTALAGFIGNLEQVPPSVSAIKVGGRRSYRLARSGAATALTPRQIQIYNLDLLSQAEPEIEILVRCSRGTYIRSIARDLGRQLGWGGAVAALKRTAIGPYRSEQALTLREIVSRSNEFSGK